MYKTNYNHLQIIKFRIASRIGANGIVFANKYRVPLPNI